MARGVRIAITTVVVAAVAATAAAVWIAQAEPSDSPAARASAGHAPTPAGPPSLVAPPGGPDGRPGGASPSPTQPPARPAAAFAMTVRYVYDGDTLQLQHDTANAVVTTTNPIRVRLIGVDTPEAKPTAQCWSAEATDALRRLAPVGSRIWVAPDRDSWDDYGRRLFSAWTDDGRFIEGELVASGAAKAIRVWPNVTNHPYLSGLEQRAASERTGQWGRC